MHIFLSYPHKDRDKAKKLQDVLFKGGHSVWRDEQLITGRLWQDQLLAQIKKSDAIALTLTPNWIASPYCQWEFITAVENGKKIIPVLLEKTSLPARISKYQYADLSDGFDDEKVEKLLNDLVILGQTIDPSVVADMDKSAYSQQIDESMRVSENNNTVTRSGNISIGGNVEGGNVNIGGSQTFHGNVVINTGHGDAPGDEGRQLEELVEQLNKALKTIPQDDAVVIESLAQDAVNEATKDAPNKRLLEIKTENLKKAAENLLAISPIVVKIVQKLLTLG